MISVESLTTLTRNPQLRHLPNWRAIVGLTLPLLWLAAYSSLRRGAAWLTSTALGLDPRSPLGAAIEFFLYETPKVLMLLGAVVFGVGVLRSFVTQQQARRALATKRREATGNVLAAALGVATPFCSCSAVPLFIGFVTAGVPLGVTFSFLIAAPMVNEVALVLLFGLFGWRVALLYLATGLAIAVLAGWVIGRLHMERHVESWVYRLQAGGMAADEPALSWRDRIEAGRAAVRDVVGKVWLYVVGGIAVGAAIHGWVPTNFFAGILGKGAWWSVPVAVLIGVPMYSNAAGVIPIVQALLGKGAALGSVLAFMMSVIALSLPELVILRKVLRPKLIATFVGVVAAGILLVGYLFNALL
jgi:uncharacterized protein